MKKIRKKSLSVLLLTVSASLLVSIGVQTFIRPTKIIFAEEITAGVRVEKDAFTGEELKVKEEVIYSGRTQTKKVFKYRTDGSLKYQDTYFQRSYNEYYLAQAIVWVMANESHTYNYFDNGSTEELRSKTITVYDSANKVIKSESYNNEEVIYNRYELLSPTVYRETDYDIYGLLASVVTKTTDGTKIGEEQYYTFVNYTTGEKKNQLVLRTENNVSNKYSYNSNGEIISERITRIFWSSNNSEVIGREEKEITYLDGKPNQATERKYYNESGKMSFAKYIDSYVYENGKERKVETRVFNEKTGELDNSYYVKGYLSDVWTYDESGRNQQRLVYDESGYLVRVDQFDESGNITTTRYDGETANTKYNVVERDENGKVIKQKLYGATEYNDKMLVEERFFNPETGKLKEVKKYQEYYGVRYHDFYDEKGIKIKTIYTRLNNEKIEMDYNSDGYITKKVSHRTTFERSKTDANKIYEKEQQKITLYDDKERMISQTDEVRIDGILKERDRVENKSDIERFSYSIKGENIELNQIAYRYETTTLKVGDNYIETRHFTEYTESVTGDIITVEGIRSSDSKMYQETQKKNNVITSFLRVEDGKTVEHLWYQDSVVINKK